MRIESQTVRDVVVVKVFDRLDEETADAFKSEFHRLMNVGNRFVIDFSDLEFMDSTGLGSIVYCLKSSQARGGNLKIASLNGRPKKVFEITRACRIFDTFDNYYGAVEAFGKSGQDI